MWRIEAESSHTELVEVDCLGDTSHTVPIPIGSRSRLLSR